MIQIIPTLQTIILLLTALVNQLSIPADEIKFGAIVPISTFEQIKDKTYKEKVNIKSDAIVKLLSKGIYTKDNYDIEIIDFSKIEEGVQVYAKAWKDGSPLGFMDGTVEIEKFRIINPRIAVPDPLGTITKTYTDIDGSIKTLTFREDLVEATKQTIAHAIKVSAKDGSKIVKGRIGNTVTTFYPDANIESTSVDGTNQIVNGTNWETTQDATTGTANDSAAASVVGTRDDAGGVTLRRAFLLFDTSSIPDTDPINSSTLSVTMNATFSNTDNDGNDFFAVVKPCPEANTSLTANDYDNFRDTTNSSCPRAVDTAMTQYSAQLDFSAFVTDSATYNDFVINAAGNASTSVTGITYYGLVEGHDLLDDPIVGASEGNYVGVIMADTADTTADPKLVVNHGVAAVSAVKKKRIIIIQ